MRMWMVDPSKMCRKHLLGEHVEIHMLIGSIKRKRKLTKFIEKGLIEPTLIILRHEQLKNEILNRGYRHDSNLDNFDLNLFISEYGIIADHFYVDKNKSLMDLCNRCDECRKNFKI